MCSCGGIIRPNIILYGEPLIEGKLWKAMEEVDNANIIIVGGTSLTVSPACALIHRFIVNKKMKKIDSKLYIINKQETPFDYYAIKYNDNLVDVFEEINRKIIKKK